MMTQVFAKVKGTSSSVGKLSALKSLDDEGKAILIAAYNADKYYVRRQNTKGYGVETLYTTDWRKLLSRLNSRTLSGDAAVIEVRNFIQQLTPPHAEVFKGVLRKNLDIGIGVSRINTVFPGLIEKWSVMLSEVFEDRLYRQDMLWSIKYNGLRGYYHKEDGCFYTRGKKRVVGIEHLEQQMAEYEHDYDGELAIPGKHFNESSGLLRSNKPCPTARYYVFDKPSAQPFYQRYESYMNDFAALSKNDFIKPVTHKKYDTLEEVHAAFDRVIDQDNDLLEGLMGKERTSKYLRKRSFSWLKMKLEEVETCTITGAYPGEGNCVGAGGLYVRNKAGVIVSVGTGFTNDHRLYIQENIEKLIDTPLLVVFQSRTPDNSFRHPRALKGQVHFKPKA